MYCILFCHKCNNNVDNINHTSKLSHTQIIYIKNLYLSDNSHVCYTCVYCGRGIYYNYNGNFCFKLVLANTNTIISPGISRTRNINYSLYRCIFSETYHPYHFTTLKKFNIELTSDILEKICKYLCMFSKMHEFISMYKQGLRFTSFDFRYSYKYVNDKNILEYLDFLKNSGIIMENYHSLIYEASFQNNIHVLNWFYKNNYFMKYHPSMISKISEYGHVDILTWWLNSGLEFNYDSDAMDWASIKGHLHVLEWWLNSGLTLKYTDKTMDTFNIDVLNWWKTSGLTLKYRSDILVDTSKATILDYNIKHYYHFGIQYMSKPIEVVKWWLNSGLHIPIEGYKSHFFFHSLQSYNLSDLECLFNTALQLKINNKL